MNRGTTNQSTLGFHTMKCKFYFFRVYLINLNMLCCKTINDYFVQRIKLISQSKRANEICSICYFESCVMSIRPKEKLIYTIHQKVATNIVEFLDINFKIQKQIDSTLFSYLVYYCIRKLLLKKILRNFKGYFIVIILNFINFTTYLEYSSRYTWFISCDVYKRISTKFNNSSGLYYLIFISN